MILEIAFYLLLVFVNIPILGYIILQIYPTQKKNAINQFINNGGVSIIVPCFNEEYYIENKINEILNWKLNVFELIIISDGSYDSTNLILDKFSFNQNIKIIKLNTRKGKPNALNLGVSLSKYEILIFSDTRQKIKNGSIKILLNNFSDSAIGAVSACIEHEKSSNLRKLINYLKILESKTGSTIGVYGALYALKKEYYKTIPPDTILDDLLISINVLIQGKLIKLEKNVMIIDNEIKTFYSQKRVIRLIRGLIQFLFVNYRSIIKLSKRNLFFFYAQKYYKLTLPFFFFTLSIIAYYLEGFYSLKFLSIIVLNVIIMIIFVRMNIVGIIIKIIFLSIINIFKKTKKQTVLWDK